MNDSISHSPEARTWRHISQDLKPRAMSARGRVRAFSGTARTVAAVTICGALAVGAIVLVATWQGGPAGMTASAGQPVPRVNLVTDGSLGNGWVEASLALPAGRALNDLDLGQLRTRLLATGRVEEANLTRVLPSTLKVVISERLPVARIRTEENGDLYVARDGIVFEPAGQPDLETFNRLPWLGGIRLTRSGAGFAPIPGMKAVADLLATAHNEAPSIYSSWVSLDLSKLESDGEIVVRSREISRIVFNTASDFYLQIARLDYLRDRSPSPLKTVDLGLGSGVVMTFEK